MREQQPAEAASRHDSENRRGGEAAENRHAEMRP
jgi:hypothetical protein